MCTMVQLVRSLPILKPLQSPLDGIQVSWDHSQNQQIPQGGNNMSQAYAEAVKANKNKKLTKSQLRKMLNKPGKRDSKGNLQYFTEQAHKH